MKLSNAQMAQRIQSLSPHLSRTDLIGYAAARNTRRLQDACKEFEDRRNALIAEMGEQELDEAGNPTGRLSIAFDSPRFEEFMSKIEKWAEIEHDVEIMTLPYEEAVGNLSGAELLEIDWMFFDKEV